MIFSSKLLEIFRRSSFNIFFRSTEELFVFFLFLVKILSNGQKWSEDLLIKSSANLLIDLHHKKIYKKIDLKKNLIYDLLKISKITRDEIFLTSRRR